MALLAGTAAVAALGVLRAPPRLAPSTEALSARNYMRAMSPGINLGNTLEAIPEETSWGNPAPTEAYFRAVRAAGFRSVRLPAAWSQYADAAYRIDPRWMAHVTDVARMANRAGLVAMVNVHWDGGWLQPTEAKREAATAKLRAFWTQIATAFREFDNGLLLAGTNEVHVEGEYGAPNPENAAVQNGFNQTFVDTVRATGGKNRSRFLVVQGYNTDVDHTVTFNAALPRDVVKDRLMMEVHFYSPYDFTLNEKSEIWQWGKNATDSKAKAGWGDEAYVDEQFAKIKRTFIDRGVPVILGEYAAGLKPKYPGMRAFRDDWDRYVTRSAYRHGLVPMYWDVGVDGLFNRTTGARRDSDLIRTIVRAVR